VDKVTVKVAVVIFPDFAFVCPDTLTTLTVDAVISIVAVLTAASCSSEAATSALRSHLIGKDMKEKFKVSTDPLMIHSVPETDPRYVAEYVSGAPSAAAEKVSRNVSVTGFSIVRSEKFEMTGWPLEIVIDRLTSVATAQFLPSPG
jgi:hypothetical protein